MNFALRKGYGTVRGEHDETVSGQGNDRFVVEELMRSCRSCDLPERGAAPLAE